MSATPPPTVQIPSDLYQAMAACFYGSGPDYWEIRGRPHPIPRNRPPAQQLPQPPDADKNGDDGGDRLAPRNDLLPLPKVPWGMRRPGYEPMGIARPTAPPPDKEGDKAA